MSIATSTEEATGSAGVWDRRLLLDLEGCRVEATRSEPAIRDFCRDLAEALDMRPCAAPALVEVGGAEARLTRLSLSQTLYGATVTGTFTGRDRDARLSILSRHAFPVEPVLRVARRHFAPQRVRETVLTRLA